MTELAKPWMVLKNWRVRNGYVTPEWESYKNALWIQNMIFGILILAIGIKIGRMI